MSKETMMTVADGRLTGFHGVIEVLRYYLGHGGVLLYLIPNLFLVTWLLVVRNPSHFAWWLVGFLAFLPQEYLTHRYLLHFNPPRNRLAYRFLYRAHYGHHEFPRRIDLMWIPVWLTAPLVIVNVALFAPIAGTAGHTLAVLSGLFTGYLLFEWCHLLCHVPLRLRSRLVIVMRRRHLLHHYRNEHFWFAVQQACWPFDAAGHTGPATRAVPRSGTSFSLGVQGSDPRVEAARKFFAPRSTGTIERSEIWL
jgi:hypothetical protein